MVLTLGKKGSGKTTLLKLQLPNQLEAGEICLWYGRETAEWVELSDHFPVRVFIPKGALYRLCRLGEGPGDQEELDILVMERFHEIPAVESTRTFVVIQSLHWSR